MFCSLSSVFYFVGDKNVADRFKYEITPSIKSNERLKFDHNISMNYVKEKGKPPYKILYKVFKEEYIYNKLTEISPFTTLIQLKDFLYGIHHCVNVVYKEMFYSNLPFTLHLTHEKLDYCCINGNQTKGMNRHQGVFKCIRFSQTDKSTSLIQNLKTIDCF